MKLLACVLLFFLTVSTSFAQCREEAKNIAIEAMTLFNVNDQDMHCTAIGGLTSLETDGHAYFATFNFPCGPCPKSPSVTMVLNAQCKIIDLKMVGHSF